MIYLFIGDDILAKDEKIKTLKADCGIDQNWDKFDYEILYGKDVAPEVLKNAFLAMPAKSKKRLVWLKNSQELNKSNQELLINLLDHVSGSLIMILDFKGDGDSALVKKLSAYGESIYFKSLQTTGGNVFDLMRKVIAKDQTAALKMLSEMPESEDPLMMMGGIVWSWRQESRRMPEERFKKGLLFLQEADRNLKRSRMEPAYCLEFLIVKLSSLD